ncbi:MAG: hypothetical protein EOO45_00785 [Flavobacterium sp.]|nr:MAG: hypothetical protein EOO45_00785 [Flavobacterium sp.]
MVEAVANAGGMGCLPLGGWSPEKTLDLIREKKSKTNRPFAVNLFAHSLATKVSVDDIEKMETYLETLHKGYNLPFDRKPNSSYRFYNHLCRFS